MAVEKIKPLKMGELADGEPMTDLVTTEVDPTADYASVKGIAFENTDSTLIDSISGNIQFTTNSLERARIDTSGNLGINTTTPGSTLDVKGTLRLSGSTSGYVGLSPAAAAGSTTYTLPSADGSLDQVLTTDGSSNLSWTTPSIEIQENDVTVVAKATILNFEGPAIYDVVNDGGGKATVQTATTICVPFVETGTAINEWLTAYDTANNGDSSPYVVPFDCEIIGVSFSNSSTGADPQIEIHSAAFGTNTSTRLLIFDCTDVRYFYSNNFTPVSLNKGQKLGVYVVDNGGNSSNIIFNVILRLTSYGTSVTVKNNAGGNLTRTASGGTTVTV